MKLLNGNQSIREIIRNRVSCRTYIKTPLDSEAHRKIELFLASEVITPFQTPLRFQLAATSQDALDELKGLGTYGVIRNPSAFIIGAVEPADKDLEDYGYQLEKIILCVSSLELGSCWLGGSFGKSGFEKKMKIRAQENIPAIAAIGTDAGKMTLVDRFIKARAASKTRKAWNELFYQDDFTKPLQADQAGNYREVLEMVRLAPSARNFQPWRLVKEHENAVYHFYLQRSEGYQASLMTRKKADLQRIDMGIALCHFELMAKELKLHGGWEIREPKINLANNLSEYLVSWVG